MKASDIVRIILIAAVAMVALSVVGSVLHWVGILVGTAIKLGVVALVGYGIYTVVAGRNRP